MLDLNSSFLWIVFLVWLLYLVLNRIFFNPIHAIISEREAKVAADSGRQESMVAEIETRTRSVEDQLSEARKLARRTKEEWLENGELTRGRTVAQARENAARLMAASMTQLAGEIAAAEQALEKQVAAFSDQIRQAYL
jgi:F0F1-type ATP synthase membrane subunit b/b'